MDDKLHEHFLSLDFSGLCNSYIFLRFRFLSVESGLKYLNYRNYLIPLMDQWRMVLILYLFFPDKKARMVGQGDFGHARPPARTLSSAFCAGYGFL